MDDGWIEGWMNDRSDGLIVGLKEGWMMRNDRRMDGGWLDEGLDEWKDRRIDSQIE